MNQLNIEKTYSLESVKSSLWMKLSGDMSLMSLFTSSEDAKCILMPLLLAKGKDIPIQNFIGSMSEYTPWEECTDLLTKYADKGLYTIVQYKSKKLAIKPLIGLGKEDLGVLAQITVLPPLIQKPKKWKNNENGGYYSIKHNAVLGRKNGHSKPLGLDVLNKLQRVTWKLNPSVLVNFKGDNCYDSEKESLIQANWIGQEFYFMWQFDKRGRIYNKGYEISFQGTEYQKACLDFANGEEASTESLRGLKIAIANAYGLDKLTWDKRLKRASELLETHVVVEEDTITILTEGAEEPILFTKYVEAYLDGLDGEDIYTPVGLDMTASGIQIMAALTGCISSAKQVNLIDVGGRADVYTSIINKMNKELSQEESVDRAIIKRPFMTHWYNSQATASRILKDSQLEAFYNAVGDVFKGPQQMMDAINNIWEDKDVFEFTLPDGHTCLIKTYVTEEAQVTLEEGITFEYEYSKHAPNGNHRHLVANIVHAVDGYICRETIRRFDGDIATIHDSFWVLPSRLEELKEVFKEVMIDLAKSDLLSDILSQLTGYPIQIEKLSKDLPAKMKDAKYILS